MKIECCGPLMGVSEHNNVVQFMITQILWMFVGLQWGVSKHNNVVHVAC